MVFCADRDLVVPKTGRVVLVEGGGYQLILESGFGNEYGRAMSAINNRFSGTGYGAGYVDGKGLLCRSRTVVFLFAEGREREDPLWNIM